MKRIGNTQEKQSESNNNYRIIITNIQKMQRITQHYDQSQTNQYKSNSKKS